MILPLDSFRGLPLGAFEQALKLHTVRLAHVIHINIDTGALNVSLAQGYGAGKSGTESSQSHQKYKIQEKQNNSFLITIGANWVLRLFIDIKALTFKI